MIKKEEYSLLVVFEFIVHYSPDTEFECCWVDIAWIYSSFGDFGKREKKQIFLFFFFFTQAFYSGINKSACKIGIQFVQTGALDSVKCCMFV